MKPKAAFEMMVWERLFAALLTNPKIVERIEPSYTDSKTDPVENAARLADRAFEEYAKRHAEMAEAFAAKHKENK